MLIGARVQAWASRAGGRGAFWCDAVTPSSNVGRISAAARESSDGFASPARVILGAPQAVDQVAVRPNPRYAGQSHRPMLLLVLSFRALRSGSSTPLANMGRWASAVVFDQPSRYERVTECPADRPKSVIVRANHFNKRLRAWNLPDVFGGAGLALSCESRRAGRRYVDRPTIWLSVTGETVTDEGLVYQRIGEFTVSFQ